MTATALPTRITNTDQDGYELTIGDFDMGTDKIVLQENYQSINTSFGSGFTDVMIRYPNGNRQFFKIYHQGAFDSAQVFTTTEPSSTLLSDDDVLLGGADADTFVVQDAFGSDTIEGGETTTTGQDLDTLDLSALTGAATVSFTGLGAGTADGSDTLSFSEIERIVGTGQGDTLDATDTGVEVAGWRRESPHHRSGLDGDSISIAGADKSWAALAGQHLRRGDADSLSVDDADIFVIEDGFCSDTIAGGEGNVVGADDDGDRPVCGLTVPSHRDQHRRSGSRRSPDGHAFDFEKRIIGHRHRSWCCTASQEGFSTVIRRRRRHRFKLDRCDDHLSVEWKFDSRSRSSVSRERSTRLKFSRRCVPGETPTGRHVFRAGMGRIRSSSAITDDG